MNHVYVGTFPDKALKISNGVAETFFEFSDIRNYAVMGLACSPDAKLIALYGIEKGGEGFTEKGRLVVVNSSGDLVLQRDIQNAVIFDMCFYGANKVLCSMDGSLLVVNLSNKTEQSYRTISLGSSAFIALSWIADTQNVACLKADGILQIRSVGEKAMSAVWEGKATCPMDSSLQMYQNLAYHPMYKKLFHGDNDGYLHIYSYSYHVDQNSYDQQSIRAHDSPLVALAVSRQYLVTGSLGSDANSVKFWQLPDIDNIGEMRVEGHITSITTVDDHTFLILLRDSERKWADFIQIDSERQMSRPKSIEGYDMRKSISSYNIPSDKALLACIEETLKCEDAEKARMLILYNQELLEISKDMDGKTKDAVSRLFYFYGCKWLVASEKQAHGSEELNTLKMLESRCNPLPIAGGLNLEKTNIQSSFSTLINDLATYNRIILGVGVRNRIRNDHSLSNFIRNISPVYKPERNPGMLTVRETENYILSDPSKSIDPLLDFLRVTNFDNWKHEIENNFEGDFSALFENASAYFDNGIFMFLSGNALSWEIKPFIWYCNDRHYSAAALQENKVILYRLRSANDDDTEFNRQPANRERDPLVVILNMLVQIKMEESELNPN